MPFNIGGPELIIVLVIVLIVFGAGKLPNVMRDFGRGVKEFKKAQTEEEAAEAARTMSATGAGTPPPATTASSNGSATGAAIPPPGPSRPAEPAPRA